MKKIISLVLALARILCFGACGKKEEQPAKKEGVHVTIVNAGDIVVANEFVEFEDFDGNGAYNIDEVLRAAHKQDGKEEDYASSEGQYGLGIAKLWGDESGAFGYYVDDASAMSLADPVVNGQKVVAFVYADQVTWSDAYSYVESAVVENGTLTVHVCKAGFDENWAPVALDAEGAEVFLNETSLGTTDAEGKVTYKLGSEKNFKLTVKGEGLVPCVCEVAVQ